MRRFSAILMLVFVTVQAFYNLGLLAYWTANRNYIATNLCENRARPELKCDGKCYLRKKIRQSPPYQQNEQKYPVFKKGMEPACFQIFSASEQSGNSSLKQKKTPFEVPVFGPQCCAGDVFHPPDCLV